MPDTFSNVINPNVPGLDASLATGQRVTTRTSAFLFNASQGAIIAALVDPFGSGSTFSTVGTVPAQLALSGSNIVKGSAAGVPGAEYKIRVLASSADGLRDTSAILSFTAKSELPPVVTPTPTPTPTPTLTLSQTSPSIASNAASGTLVSNISNVPAGATPTVTPNDGRLIIAGDASAGWKVVVGMSALSAGTINFSVAASGATGAAGVLTVTAGVTALVYPTLYVVGASVEQFGTTAMSALRWGMSPAGLWNVANELDGSRLYDYDAASQAATPFFSAPTNYASGGASFTVAGDRTSINTQMAAVLDLLPTKPSGKRAVYYSPGRNGLTDGAPTADYLSAQEAHIRQLSAAADLVIVPGLWMRATSTGGLWVSGGSARQAVYDVNTATQALCASLPNVIFVPLMDAMCDATGDRNPKSGYTSDGIHPLPRGAQAGARAHRDVLIASGRFTAMPFPTISNLAPSLSTTGGLLVGGATGTVPTSFSGQRNDATTTLAFSQPSPGVERIALTRAVSQTGAWAAATFFQSTGNVAVAGASYRARVKAVVAPTPVPIVLEFFISEFKDGAVVARAVGRWALGATTYNVPKDVAITDMAPIDASSGMTLWLETPTMPIRSTSGTIDTRMWFRVCTLQGGTETVQCDLSDLQLERVA